MEIAVDEDGGARVDLCLDVSYRGSMRMKGMSTLTSLNQMTKTQMAPSILRRNAVIAIAVVAVA